MTITAYNKKGHQIIKHITDKEISLMQLDWINNFLTVDRFAEHYNITYYSAKRIIEYKY